MKKGPVTQMREDLLEREKQVVELKDKYLRAVAELDNFRKLMQKEKEEYRKSSKVSVLDKIIPVLDSFNRALEGAHDNTDFENFLKGVEIIHRQLKEALKTLGLVEFSGLGEVFDPSRHEAVAMVETDDQPEHMVIEEISKGYMINDQIVKPAKVVVSKPKEGGQEDGENNRN